MEPAVQMLERWVAEYQPLVYRAACLVLGDPALAEDVAQETFVRAWRAAGRLRPGAEVRPWLYRIATNLARNHLRARRREQRAVVRLEAGEAGEDLSEVRAVRAAVGSAVGRLPERLRLPLVLRYYLDLSEQQIARALRVRPGTVKSRLHDARRLLAGDDAILAAADGT